MDMKKILFLSGIFFSGMAIGYFGNYLNYNNKNGKNETAPKFDFENYNAGTSYEIWNDKLDSSMGDGNWNLERKIKIDNIDNYQLTITGVNDRGETERFSIKSKEPLSILGFLNKNVSKK